MKLLRPLSIILLLILFIGCGNKTNYTSENDPPKLSKEKKSIDTVLLKNEAKSGFDTLIMNTQGKILKDTRTEFNYSNPAKITDSSAQALMIADSTAAMVFFDSIMKVLESTKNKDEALKKVLESFKKNK